MIKKFFFVIIASMTAVSVLLTLVPSGETAKAPSLVGTYRCWQYNVDGSGGSCRLVPPLILKKGGQYQISSERGTYTITNTTLKLSKSKIRGAGTILANGNQIRFSYSYQGLKHTITYLRVGAQVSMDQKEATTSLKKTPSSVEVDITVEFSKPDGGLAWINSIQLVPEGTSLEKAPIRYDGLALVEGNQHVTASFFGNKEVQTGMVYDVYTNSGTERLLVGKLDTKNATGKITKTYTYQLGGTQTTTSISPSLQPQKDTSSRPYEAPCNPNVPRYAQPSCVE